MIRLNDILDKASYNPQADLDLIKKAYVFSAQAHRGHLRLSGEPYLSHPLEVSGILADLRVDVATIAAGLLHDTVEDSHATLEEIESIFGHEVSSLVDGSTKIEKFPYKTSEEAQAENYRKMLLAMVKDIRVILIKLADRLHNMRTLKYHTVEKQTEIAQETMDIYVPLANRLGIGWMKTELEDLSFKHITPEAYYSLAQKVAKKRKEREKYVAEEIRIISEELAKYGLEATVTGRPKHLYSIYKKMGNQNIEFDQVSDLRAFRVIVKTIKDCYTAFGIIHALWTPVPGRFKDYIALPKSNMYQSLHTTVIGPYGERIEIQIRTEQMHKIAEEGIAAHWKYKEGKVLDEKDDKKFSWLRQLLEWLQDLKDPKEFLETVKIDLFPDEVYVFTPKGDVKAFPMGATPIDFAYSIHTEIGHHCAGAKVNGKIVPLKHCLNSGDTVEILTSPNQKPSPDWLKIVKTSRAKERVRQWLRSEQRVASIELGKNVLEKELRKYHTTISQLMKKEEWKKLLEEYHIEESEDLFSLIAYGKISVHQILSKVLPPEKLGTERTKEPSKLEQILRKVIPWPKDIMEIDAIDGILVRSAKCCNPIPGDEVIGFITRGRGLTIHRNICSNVLNSDPVRKIEINWTPKEKFPRLVRIRVNCVDKKGLLANITSAISGEEVNISQIHGTTTGDSKALNIFEVEVINLEQLQKLIKSIGRVQGVFKVERIAS